VQPVIVDEKGVEIEGECSGYLCIKSSWPGAFRTVYADHERYETTYFKPFPGYYFIGDGCNRLVDTTVKLLLELLASQDLLFWYLHSNIFYVLIRCGFIFVEKIPKTNYFPS